ncbi:MAG: heat-inducible transcriptional repressor HrcA [Chlamydiales bacterium]|nr:heat-inducible transcriptional repressor HrcA [Chlamydiales bacterium]
MKKTDLKKNPKKDRERKVLLGLIDLFVRTGKPIGSNTLKDHGFEAISSATIRNYFAKLEKEGYLKQHHTSGGRVPTDLAYKFYATAMEETYHLEPHYDLQLHTLLSKETQEINTYLEQSLDHLSMLTNCACFLSAPIFDQDFIVNVKLVGLDTHRILCIILTNFGFVHTEVLYTQIKLGSFSLKRIEEFFAAKLSNQETKELSGEERTFAERCFNEIALRNILHFTTPQKSPIYKAGLAQLLKHPECQDTTILSNGLQIFDKPNLISSLLKETLQLKKLKFWIGKDLQAYSINNEEFSLIAIPYYIHHRPVGALAILGPSRMHYPKYFAILDAFSKYLSENLTKSIYKFKIAWHQAYPEESNTLWKSLEFSSQAMIEDKRK